MFGSEVEEAMYAAVKEEAARSSREENRRVMLRCAHLACATSTHTGGDRDGIGLREGWRFEVGREEAIGSQEEMEAWRE